MKLLTVAEVAEICRTTENTVRYWEYQGTGPESIKIGRRRLFPEDSVNAFLDAARKVEAVEAQSRPAAAEPPVTSRPTRGAHRGRGLLNSALSTEAVDVS